MIQSGDIAQDPDRPLESLFPRLSSVFIKHNDVSYKYMLDDRIMGVIEQLYEEEALVVQTVFYYKAPASRGLPPHQDNYDIGAEPKTVYGAWIDLDGSEVENGGLFFVPGSHKYGLVTPNAAQNDNYMFKQDIPTPEGHETVDIITEAGDVVYFSGDLIHGSHKNKTETRFRRSLVTHFCPKSVEKITLNYKNLTDKHGNRVRKRLNINPQAVEFNGSVSTWKNTYYPKKGTIY